MSKMRDTMCHRKEKEREQEGDLTFRKERVVSNNHKNKKEETNVRDISPSVTKLYKKKWRRKYIYVYIYK